MDQVVFSARTRTNLGSADSRRMRRNGRIPGVLYGREGQPMPIDLDAKDFSNHIKGVSENSILVLDINGTVHNAVIKDTQWNMRTGLILHLDFYEVKADTLLKIKVPLAFVGTPQGLVQGGILETPNRDIEIACLPVNLPAHISVDVSSLDRNQSILAKDIVLGPGLTLVSSGDAVVAVVKSDRMADEAEVEAAT